MEQVRPCHQRDQRTKLFLARPFFRYSYSRDAYVLRGIGNTKGPVLVTEQPEVEPLASETRTGRFEREQAPVERAMQ